MVRKNLYQALLALLEAAKLQPAPTPELLTTITKAEEIMCQEIDARLRQGDAVAVVSRETGISAFDLRRRRIALHTENIRPRADQNTPEKPRVKRASIRKPDESKNQDLPAP